MLESESLIILERYNGCIRIVTQWITIQNRTNVRANTYPLKMKSTRSKNLLQ